jgi:hypothetical protein
LRQAVFDNAAVSADTLSQTLAALDTIRASVEAASNMLEPA